jgi:hypothetical protein
MDLELQRARAGRLWPVLTDVAATPGSTITYGALGDATGLHHRSLSIPLGLIQDFCTEHGTPQLTSLVVLQDTRRPSTGNAVSGEELAREYEAIAGFAWSSVANPFAAEDVPDMWWDGLGAEKYWLESTDRPDLGVNLLAPISNVAGQMLVRFVNDGDVVLHYHQPTRSIVAFSIAHGFPQETTMRWPDRISSPEVPARVEELIHFTELDEPVTLEAIRERDTEIREIKSRLEAENHGATIYYPFAIWDHEIRPSQGMYLSKLPVEVLRLYPDMAAQVGEGIDLLEVAEGTQDISKLPTAGARPPVGASSGRSATSGRQSDEKKKKAVEDWAMKRATKLF